MITFKMNKWDGVNYCMNYLNKLHPNTDPGGSEGQQE